MQGKKESTTTILNQEVFSEKYTNDKILGEGTFGEIYKIQNKQTKEFFACKTISKARLTNIKTTQEEIKLLKSLDHPHIINLYEVYEGPRNFFLVLEQCCGGSLEDKIINSQGKKLSEKKVSEIMEQIFEAINHIHAQGIAHRDLKPENILFQVKDDDNSLKLIDFGLGKDKKDSDVNNFVGSPQYVAPEVLEGEFELKCDIWSAGVIMYSLLSGKLPFDGKDRKEIFANIKKGELCFPPQCNYNFFFNF